jgi:hypothetical protein
MPRSRIAEIARLAGCLTCIALATSRIGLVAHELVGHGGVTLAVGGQIGEVRLFWFAGGWVHSQLAEPTIAKWLAIAMGGIAVELVAGAAIVAFARGRIVRAIGAAIALHGSWYLATGAWSGFGDGQLLYRVLGDWRYPVAIAAGSITCAAAYFGAKQAFGALAGAVSSHRVAWTLVAIAIAAALNVALAIGEVRVRRDRAYAQVMAPERERIVARELDAWQVAQGSAATEPAIAEHRATLEAEHKTFPFWLVLAACTALAVIAGARRSPLVEQATLALRGAAIAAAISIGGVIALSYVL